MIDLKAVQKRLRWLKLANALTWLLTIALFILPVYQWLCFGKIPINTSFFVSTIANCALLAVSVKLLSLIHFSKYQIRYFSRKQESASD